MSISNCLINRYKDRKPDFVIKHASGVPAVYRWWVIPRNSFFNVYLHHIVESDDARALHDHPWWNLSCILRGCYDEVRFTELDWEYAEHYNELTLDVEYETARRNAGNIVLRRAKTPHRIQLLPKSPHRSPIQLDVTCWSLFITGPVIRRWGFWCSQGWRYFKDFVKLDGNESGVGRGCE